jgi:hypothetical protein
MPLLLMSPFITFATLLKKVTFRQTFFYLDSLLEIPLGDDASSVALRK